MLRSNVVWTHQQPAKPVSALRTISEAAAELGLEPHVLRFWERKFSQISPVKRGGGRRYYRVEDIELLRRIRSLLYNDGYTIKGVQRLLDSESDQPTPRVEIAHLAVPPAAVDTSGRQELEDTLGDLRRALALLREALH